MDITAVAERPATPADDALIERARHGDAAAFDDLVRARIDRCYRLAWSILLNDADAADATQEAFVSAWRQLPRLRDTSAFDGWLNQSSPTLLECPGATDSGCARCRSGCSGRMQSTAHHRPSPPPPRAIRVISIGSTTPTRSAGRSIGCASRSA